MSWVKAKIGEIITLKRGYDLPSSSRLLGNIPIVSSSGVSDYHNQSKKDGPGVITGRYGTLGKVFYVKGEYWPLNTTLYVIDFKGNDSKFIYYFLKTLKLDRFNGAAAVPGLDRNVLHKIEVNYPEDISTQKKIASILSAYDDLIENNNQRIQLLEEMAEEIYKEWFVRLRFPGYQDSKFFDKNGKEVPHGTVGALPEGWKKSMLKHHLEYFRGKSYSSAELREDEGVPMLNLKNVNRGGGFRRDGLKFFEGKYSKNNEAYSGDIIMAVTDMTQEREIVGRVARVPEMNYEKFIISMDLIRIEPLSLPKLYFYSFFRYSGIGFQLKEFANGANVLHLTPNLIGFRKAIIPSQEICVRFERLIEPMISDIDLLEKKNQVLQETRDLLLPRLISGKLNVDDLDVENNPITAMAAEPEEVYKS